MPPTIPTPGSIPPHPFRRWEKQGFWRQAALNQMVLKLPGCEPSLLAPPSPFRRWEKRGFLQQAALNQTVLLGFKLGVGVDTLAGWYGGR